MISACTWSCNFVHTDLSLREARQRVLDILGSVKHRLSISASASAFGPLACATSASTLPKSNSRQRNAPPPIAWNAFPMNRWYVQAVETQRAGQGDLRVVVRDRGADVLVGSSEPALGRNDVRAAAKHVDRLFVAGIGRHDGTSRTVEILGVGPRLRTHQHVQTVQLLFQTDAQRRHARARLLQQGVGLGDLAPGCGAGGDSDHARGEEMSSVSI